MRHELTHDAMLRHYDAVEHLPPFWITEGLATAFEVTPDQDGQAVIQQDKLNLLPLITQVANQNADSIAYAQAWGLTFYLLHHQTAAIRAYLADYQQTHHQTSADHPRAFEQFFQNSKPLGELARLLKRWILLQKFD